MLWLRHGETQANRQRRYMGHLDLPLSERGWMQAHQLGDILEAYPVDYVVTSDLLRCRQTASIYQKKKPSLPLVVTKQLRECHFGRWEGFTFNEIQASDSQRLKKWLDDPWNQSPPGGESLQDLDRRICDWLNQWEKQQQTMSCVAIFSHGGPIRCFLAKYVYQDWSAFWEIDVPHGGGWCVEKVGGRWLIREKIGKREEE